MRVLAIDHGLARCGVAVSDRSGTIARPLEPIEPPDAGVVAALAASEEAGEIVVGLPLSLDGSEGEQAEIVREFCVELGQASELPIRLWDERLTTAMAGASRRAGARAAEDSLAAAHLLDSYLTRADADDPDV